MDQGWDFFNRSQSTFGDSTGGTGACQPTLPGLKHLHNPEEQNHLFTKQPNPLHLIDRVHPVLTQKLSDHSFIITLPFSQINKWHQTNILTIIAQFQQDCLFKQCQEFKRKVNLKFEVVEANMLMDVKA